MLATQTPPELTYATLLPSARAAGNAASSITTVGLHSVEFVQQLGSAALTGIDHTSLPSMNSTAWPSRVNVGANGRRLS